MKRFLIIVGAVTWIASSAYAQTLSAEFSRNLHLKSEQTKADPQLIKWLKTNVSKETGLPLSFQVPVESKKGVYSNMGEQFSVAGIIERVIVEEGLVIYDGAVRQIVLSMLGGKENMADADRLTQVFWQGGVGDLQNVRAGFSGNGFIYNPKNPKAVSSDLADQGRRGFLFRIINANGRYNTQDPLDGKKEFQGFPTWPTVHWEDWKPIAGENAWVTMAALQLYHKKYFDPQIQRYRHDENAVELKLAQELARAAIMLQADNGGIRMAPMGTYMAGREDGGGWYDLISTENNLSWYAAFRMLYQITRDDIYKTVMNGLESYFKIAWNPREGYFYQGMAYRDGAWQPETKHFATDVQTWGILVLGPESLDTWFGEGAAYQMWQAAKMRSGSYTKSGALNGVGFTTEHDRVSVEWTAGAIFAARLLARHYETISPLWAQEALVDASSMRQGIEVLRADFPEGQAAYAYSSKRAWIPFGWYSHDPDVLSLASTAWVVLLDADFNPFHLTQVKSVVSLGKIAQAHKN